MPARSAFCASVGEYVFQSKEDFDQFFKRYNVDRSFQLSRTVFPLKIEIAEDGEPVKTKLLQKAKWQHVNLLDKKYIIKKTPKGSTAMVVTLQIEDTGVFIEHFFQLDKGIWKLISTKDSST